MDPFELLKADHKKVAQLFDEMESASGKTKLSIFKQIKNELDLHTHIEEAIFYPVVEKPQETHDLTLEAYEEHNVVKELLKELSGARSANDEWQAKAKVLRENVEHHVEEEESKLFPKAKDVLDDEEIEDIGDRMEAEKARKLGRRPPSPARAKKRKPGILTRVARLVGLAEPARAAKRGSKRRSASKKRPAKSRKAAPVSRKRASVSTAKRTTRSRKGVGVVKGRKR